MKYDRLPIMPELPEGARVSAVCYQFETDTFLFRIEHESFAPVDPTMVLPVEPGFLSLQYRILMVEQLKDVAPVASTPDTITHDSLKAMIEKLPPTPEPTKSKGWEFLGAP